MSCPTCNIPQSEHTEDMAAKCAVFDLSANAVSHASEAENAPGVCEGSPPPAAPGASSDSYSKQRKVIRDSLFHSYGVTRNLYEQAEDVINDLGLFGFRIVSEERGVSPVTESNISVASVLLGWCNQIKRELEEFANDGPVGPMVPYRLDENTQRADLVLLHSTLFELGDRLRELRVDVYAAMEQAKG